MKIWNPKVIIATMLFMLPLVALAATQNSDAYQSSYQAGYGTGQFLAKSLKVCGSLALIVLAIRRIRTNSRA
jgi:hypothetical protein